MTTKFQTFAKNVFNGSETHTIIAKFVLKIKYKIL